MADAQRPRGRRTGRPAGESGNREAILAAARREFFAQGYERATIRGIAAGAGVDPALVHHYFGTKGALLLEVLTQGGPDRLRPEAALAHFLEGGTDHIGERIVRSVLDVYAPSVDPVGWSLLSGLLRLAVTNQDAARRLREMFARSGGLARLVRALGLPDPERRLALLAPAVLGLAVARFLIRIEPVASADAETLVAWYAPIVDRALFGPLPEEGSKE